MGQFKTILLLIVTAISCSFSLSASEVDQMKRQYLDREQAYEEAKSDLEKSLNLMSRQFASLLTECAEIYQVTVSDILETSFEGQQKKKQSLSLYQSPAQEQQVKNLSDLISPEIKFSSTITERASFQRMKNLCSHPDLFRFVIHFVRNNPVKSNLTAKNPVLRNFMADKYHNLYQSSWCENSAKQLSDPMEISEESSESEYVIMPVEWEYHSFTGNYF